MSVYISIYVYIYIYTHTYTYTYTYIYIYIYTWQPGSRGLRYAVQPPWGFTPPGPGPGPIGLGPGPIWLSSWVHLAPIGLLFDEFQAPDAKKSRILNFQIFKIPKCHFLRFQKSNVPQELPKCHFSRFRKSNVPQTIPKCNFPEFQKSNAQVQTSK